MVIVEYYVISNIIYLMCAFFLCTHKLFKKYNTHKLLIQVDNDHAIFFIIYVLYIVNVTCNWKINYHVFTA